MRIILDSRLRLVTVRKIERLQARIDALIEADLAAHAEKLRRERAAVPLKPNGHPDRRTRAWREHRPPAPDALATPPLAPAPPVS